jgi:haloalkane dehalogenase
MSRSGISTPKFEPGPSLPEWLQKDFPYNRRIFYGNRYAIHFVDEGRGPVVLLQHGNPTWSFLWRKVIRVLIAANVRVVAPDLIGLGLSDKPREASMHTLVFHADHIGSLVEALGLEEVTIVGQDWGGPVLGMVAAQNRAKIHGAVFANTSIRAPSRIARVTTFHRISHLPIISDILFRGFNLPVAMMHMVQGDHGSIGRRQRRAYRYPLRSLRDRVAPLALARMVPTSMGHPTVKVLEKVDAWARSFKGPVSLIWGTRDPILGPSLKGMRSLFPQAEVTETSAGHFLQEEVPEILAEAILRVISKK